MSSSTVTIYERVKSHSGLLIVFILVVLGVIVWKLTNSGYVNGDNFLDAGLAEIRAQVLASAYKKQSPDNQSCQTGLCPLVSKDQPMYSLFKGATNTSVGVGPCYLGLKDITPDNSLKPMPEKSRPIPQQFPKCIRCEDIINRDVTITPTNGAFNIGHFLGKKKDNNSVVIIPEVINNAAIRKVTDGKFRCILGLSDPIHGVTIYHSETDSVIARDAAGRVALAPISNFAGDLASAATFHLVDGPINYSAVAFKCIPIGKESEPKYLGFAPNSTPGGSPLIVISATTIFNNYKTNTNNGTFEFDLLDMESGIPVIMNKHSGLQCTASIENFESSNAVDDNNMDSRDKRIVRSLVLEGELGPLEIPQKETNGAHIITGYENEIQGMKPADILQLPSGLPQVNPPATEQPIEIDRPFSTDEGFADTIGMLDITLDELGKIPENLFQPASGLAFNNALNVQNQVYKNDLSDQVYQKLINAKQNPSVNNILDYNTTSYKIYQDENQVFEDKIAKKNNHNTTKLDNLIAELDKQRVLKMSKDFFFMRNQFEKANTKPIYQ